MNLESSDLFTPWTDPKSGVSSYILTQKVAPHQQSFYFTNPAGSPDKRYYWFYCAYPPSGNALDGRTLGYIDFAEQTVRNFPETMFTDGSPAIHPQTGEIYWCTTTAVYRRKPEPDAIPVLVANFPDELASLGHHSKIATHLSFSADCSELAFDCDVGLNFVVGSIRLSDGKFTVWQKFDRCYDHAMFSPIDPDLMLICQDGWTRKDTGKTEWLDIDENGEIERLWLIRRDETAQRLHMRDRYGCHECFSKDGKYVYYVDWEHGITRINLDTRQTELMTDTITWHGIPSSDQTLLVGDNYPQKEGFYRGTPADVVFYDTVTQKSIKIVSDMPAIFTRENPSRYHTDPHPQFVFDDEYISYTTTVLGQIDIAFVKVEDLLSVLR